jgi:predicted ATPase/class 3 adenylate cyclase
MEERLIRKVRAIMFTDMVGFTQIMGQDEELGLRVRRRHMDVLEESHLAFQGEIVGYFGDGTLSLFSNPLDAVLCAIESQKEFGKPPEVPVRIGIHLGQVIIQPDGIIGDAVNIASRMESFSVPGGVLISDAVEEQIKNQPQIETVSLGKFRLKHVERPFEIFAVSAPGLAVPDPAHLEGKGEKMGIFPGGLPAQATPLLGREAEVAEIVERLSGNQIVTITGPGGIGKTRLAIEVTSRLAGDFAGRLIFVPMATVSDASRFLPALASALNIKEAEGRGYRDGITAVIGDRRALLVLDNLEQIIDSAVDIADLVSSCSNLKILATSRTPLRLSGEQEYPLSPLSLPGQDRLASFEEVLASPAVALFADRAAKANHRFRVTQENAPAVAEICRRLDGLPLALELAAARIRLLSPGVLLQRLDRTLDVLGQGPRDLPARHQTLRATIDWSHSLLSEAEKVLFRRLAVFSGGFTLEGAEKTGCGAEGGFVLDDLASLLDQGLVRHAADEDRYTILQTIKEYAQEKLESAGESAEISRNHARYFQEIARRIHRGTQGDEQLKWMARGIREEANVHSALAWSLTAARDGDEEAADIGLALCGQLWIFWHILGMHLEARKWVEELLEAAGDRRKKPAVCSALLTAGLCSWTLGDFPRAIEEYEACYQLARELEMGFELAAAAGCLAVSHLPLGELELAAKYAKESIALCREIDNQWWLGFSLAFDGLLSLVSGQPDQARARYEEALAIQRKIGDYEGGALSLGGLALLASSGGDYRQAVELYELSLDSYATVGDRAEEARILDEMAWTYLKLEDTTAARSSFAGSIQAYQEVGSLRGIGLALFGLAAAELVEGSAYRAAQIAAAAERFSEEEGIVNIYAENHPAGTYVEQARGALHSGEVERSREEGRALALEDVLEMAGLADEAPTNILITRAS